MDNAMTAGRLLNGDRYRPDIDGLRAIAVSLVVIAHAFPTLLRGGFIGVDIFFVISGYLISAILIADLESGRFSVPRFYVRRIRRVFPAMILILLVTILIGWSILFRPEFAMLGRHALASGLFSENILLWGESGYFDIASDKKPLLHLWSLAIEEQFYIVWPLLMYVAHRSGKYLAVIGLTFAISFAINLHNVYGDPVEAYYSPFGRFWELMVGALLAYQRRYRPALLDRHRDAQSIAGFALLALSVALIDPARIFPGFWAMMPTTGTFLLISGEGGWINRRILSATPLIWLGLISYPLYLWHWPLLSFCHIVYGNLTPAKAIVLVALAVALATLTFMIVERPFRTGPASGTRAMPLAIMMGAVMIVGAWIMTGAILPRLLHFDAPTRTEWDFLKARTADFDRNGNGVYPLHADRRRLALFIGDSHMAQYAERIDRVIGEGASRLGAIMVVGGGCDPIDGTFSSDRHRRGCPSLRDRAYRMAASPRIRTVVIGGDWGWYLLDGGFTIDDGGKRIALASDAGRALALDRLEQRLSRLVRSGKRVVLMIDNPRSPWFESSGALVRFGPSTTGFTPGRTIRIDQDQLALRDRLIALARRAGAETNDPFSLLCKGDRCLAIDDGGRPLYTRFDHLNPDWIVNHADYVDRDVTDPDWKIGL